MRTSFFMEIKISVTQNIRKPRASMEIERNTKNESVGNPDFRNKTLKSGFQSFMHVKSTEMFGNIQKNMKSVGNPDFNDKTLKPRFQGFILKIQISIIKHRNRDFNVLSLKS